MGEFDRREQGAAEDLHAGQSGRSFHRREGRKLLSLERNEYTAAVCPAVIALAG
jgi:hypothetical protein